MTTTLAAGPAGAASALPPVSALGAPAVTSSTVTLTWTNPNSAAVRKVVVRKAKGKTPPANPTGGTAAGTVALPASTLTVKGLAAATSWAFSVFTTDGKGHFSARATKVVTTSAKPGGSGTVRAWGDGAEGEMGDGSGQWDSCAPVTQVSGLSGVTAIAGGFQDGYALLSDGSVWAWGQGGRLGNGTFSNSDRPVRVKGLTGVTAIASQGSVAYALRSDGTVWSWGEAGGTGALGNGRLNQAYALTPVQVKGLTGVTAIASGLSTGYALRSDGTVWAWGGGEVGELGNGKADADGNGIDTATPVRVKGLTAVTTVGAGWSDGYAVRSDGSVWAWGSDAEGELGGAGNGNFSLVPVQVTGLSGANAIVGGRFATYALRSDGSVWAWGAPVYNQVGLPDIQTPAPYGELSQVVSIAATEQAGYAARSDGTVWTWGYYSWGVAGNCQGGNGASPVQVPGLTGISRLAGGQATGFALKA